MSTKIPGMVHLCHIPCGSLPYLDPSGMFGRIYEGDYQTLLHTKYRSFEPCGFREEVYLCHPFVSLCELSVAIALLILIQMSRLMGKPTICICICICENKGTDQLRGNREADQRLCFRYSDSTIPFLHKCF